MSAGEWVELPVDPRGSLVVYRVADREVSMEACGWTLMAGGDRQVRTDMNAWPGEDAAWVEIAALPPAAFLPWSRDRGIDRWVSNGHSTRVDADWAEDIRRAVESGGMDDPGMLFSESDLGEPNAMTLLLEGRLRRLLADRLLFPWDTEGSAWDVAVLWQDRVRLRKDGDGLETPEGNPGVAKGRGGLYPYWGDDWYYEEELSGRAALG